MEKFSEIIQRMRDYHLIVRVAKDLENKHSYELTDDLGINSDSISIHRGLKYHLAVIILNHLEEGIE
jgi:hypothetical protein